MDYSHPLASSAPQSAPMVALNPFCSVRRYFAYLVDSVLLGVAAVFLVYALGWLRFSSVYVTDSYGQPVKVFHATFTGGFGAYLFMGIVTFAYFVILEWAAGFTIGKMLFGLRVVTTSGDQISVGQAVVRNLLLFVDTLFGCLVALASMLASDCRQRVGDRVAGTVVVRS